MTASAVPAIDFAWHIVTNPKTNSTLDVKSINLDPKNRNYLFTELLNKM